MRRRLLVATGVLLAVVAVAITAGGAYAYFWENGRADVLATGITVAGVDVGGMHADEARSLLEQFGVIFPAAIYNLADLNEALRLTRRLSQDEIVQFVRTVEGLRP